MTEELGEGPQGRLRNALNFMPKRLDFDLISRFWGAGEVLTLELIFQIFL